MPKNIHYAKTATEITNCFPVLQELRPHLNKHSFVAHIKRQQQQGYHLIYLKEHDKVHSAAGYRILEYLAWGKILYIDDLITLSTERGKGHGKHLLTWLIQHAKEKHCDQLHLDTGHQRHAAHRLYLKAGLQITSHHLSLNLKD
jgi:GNAT superfamily N-acetyltransferase